MIHTKESKLYFWKHYDVPEPLRGLGEALDRHFLIGSSVSAIALHSGVNSREAAALGIAVWVLSRAAGKISALRTNSVYEASEPSIPGSS